VADGRYRAGVGSILDLLTAQSALADARSQEAQARSLWFLSMAQLAYATGALAPGGPLVPRAAAPETGGAP
jgi:outer membrane protein TolC